MDFIRNFVRNHQGNFLRFSAVGFMNTIIDFGAFAVFYYAFSFSVLAGHVCSFLLATCNSFLLNKFWTFRQTSRHDSLPKQMILFLAVTGSGLVVSALALLFFNQFVHVLLAKFLTIGVTLVWNYTGAHLLVFNKEWEEGQGDDSR